MQRIGASNDALDTNNTIARANRRDFDRAGLTVVNLMSAPGAGKTTLLERTLERFEGRDPHERTPRLGVIEADVHVNARRLIEFHIPLVQITTDGGFGGECHLDANMVRSAIPSMSLDTIDLLVIENVGSLVSPAAFHVGENHRVMITSVTEGEDKPIKYPLMFRACELVIVNKVDLLPYLDFDLPRFLANIEDVHPGVPCLMVSARGGDGVDAWCRWLASRCVEHPRG